jgi:hypothetical protein
MNLKNVYEDFASMYIANFMETVVNGCRDGLFGNVIKTNEGKFTLLNIQEFIDFQHGKEFTHNFSVPELELLKNNPIHLCQALFKHVDDDWFGKSYYIKDVCPDLIKNTKESLLKIIENQEIA